MNITVTLTEREVAIINEAMTTWQNEPEVGHLQNAIFHAIMHRDEERGSLAKKLEAAAEESKAQALKLRAAREREAVMLRAKLIQAEMTQGNLSA
jgi:hypothetical protein